EFGQGGEREIEVGLGQLGVLDRVERAERRIDPAFGQTLLVEEALEVSALRFGAALGRGGGEGVAAAVVSGIRGDLRGEQVLRLRVVEREQPRDGAEADVRAPPRGSSGRGGSARSRNLRNSQRRNRFPACRRFRERSYSGPATRHRPSGAARSRTTRTPSVSSAKFRLH